VLHPLRLSFSILPCLLVAGCWGIGHVNVLVSPLHVEALFVQPEGMHARRVTIAHAHYYGEDRLFADLLRGTLDPDGHSYTFVLEHLSGSQTLAHTFPEDHRYVGFPVLLVPLGPSRRSTESRTLFMMLEGETTIYRINIRGSRARASYAEVDQLDLPASPRSVPAHGESLADWQALVAAEHQFYRNVNWQRAAQIEIAEVRRSDEQDFLAVRFRPPAEPWPPGA
jgi:hypothetical protein